MTDDRDGQRKVSRTAGGRSDRRRATLALVAGVAVLLLMSLGFVLAGTTALSAPDALSALLRPQTMPRAAVSIVWQLRLPRLVAALVCGSALAVSGLLLQAALGNRLASPSVMGVNAGAGLAVLISGLAFPLSVPARQAMALAGALLATLLVTLVSRRAGVSRTSLVLAGIAISSLSRRSRMPSSRFARTLLPIGSPSGWVGWRRYRGLSSASPSSSWPPG